MSLKKREEMVKDEYNNILTEEYWNKLRLAEETFGVRTDAYKKRRNEINDWEKKEHYLLYIKYRVEPPSSLKAWINAVELGTEEAMADYYCMMRERWINYKKKTIAPYFKTVGGFWT